MTDEDLQKIKLRHFNNNLEVYSKNRDLFILYDQYIEKIVEFFDFIKTDHNDFLYTTIFDILMEIGFFSYNHHFNSNLNTFKELTSKPGISVINGAGVCRNIACFYENIFEYFYNYPLKLCCYDTLGDSNKDTKIFGNHVINLTIYRDVIYGFDIMNHCVFKVINNNTLQGFDFNHYLTYMPGGDLILNLTTNMKLEKDIYREIKIKQNILELTSKKQVMTKEEYEDIINKANIFIIERRKLFQSFMIQNHNLTHEIKKKMLLLK